MTQYDLDIEAGTGWIVIVPQGTFAFVHNDAQRTVYYRFGSDSTSSGVAMKRGEYIKVDEAVYFRNSPHAPMKLTVVGD